MAKLVIELIDLPGGELSLSFSGDGLRAGPPAAGNTAVQNLALALSAQLRAWGLKAPDLSSVEIAVSDQKH